MINVEMLRKKILFFHLIFLMLICNACKQRSRDDISRVKISLVNAPTDIVTLGANFLSEKISMESKGRILPQVYHSGVLSGGKGSAEIELCQQGTSGSENICFQPAFFIPGYESGNWTG
jgi:TRAP-type C4-dicarboxylate transport system substrate-binding protein